MRTGRPRVYDLSPDIVEAAYRDESMSLRSHAKAMGVSYAALKAAIHRFGLRGRHWALCCPRCGATLRQETAHV